MTLNKYLYFVIKTYSRTTNPELIKYVLETERDMSEIELECTNSCENYLNIDVQNSKRNSIKGTVPTHMI